jgi:hypothetical protein
MFCCKRETGNNTGMRLLKSSTFLLILFTTLFYSSCNKEISSMEVIIDNPPFLLKVPSTHTKITKNVDSIKLADFEKAPAIRRLTAEFSTKNTDSTYKAIFTIHNITEYNDIEQLLIEASLNVAKGFDNVEIMEHKSFKYKDKFPAATVFFKYPNQNNKIKWCRSVLIENNGIQIQLSAVANKKKILTQLHTEKFLFNADPEFSNNQ